MFYSCTHSATIRVKGLKALFTKDAQARTTSGAVFTAIREPLNDLTKIPA